MIKGPTHGGDPMAALRNASCWGLLTLTPLSILAQAPNSPPPATCDRVSHQELPAGTQRRLNASDVAYLRERLNKDSNPTEALRFYFCSTFTERLPDIVVYYDGV